MPRYLVERTFIAGHTLPNGEQDHQARLIFDGNNTAEGVMWIHSYVTEDKKKTFCIYDAPTPAAIRRAAQRNQLPVDRITQIHVLDPYGYK